MDAAEALFQRHGYGGAAVEDVTNAVGVRKPDLYNHFRDKAELYVAVRRRALDRLDAALRDVLEMNASCPFQLRAVAGTLLRHPAFLDAIGRREAETFLPDSTRDLLFARAYAVLYQPLTALFRACGAREDEIPFLYDALVGLASHFGPVTPEPAVANVAARIIRLLLPDIGG